MQKIESRIYEMPQPLGQAAHLMCGHSMGADPGVFSAPGKACSRQSSSSRAVAARKLEPNRPPHPKPETEGKSAQIILHPCSDSLESTVQHENA